MSFLFDVSQSSLSSTLAGCSSLEVWVLSGL